jgi:hypothetical protein
MSSDRNIYDEGAYLKKTSESSKPINYMLDINRQENCQVCGDTPNVAKHVDRVSLENDLLGHTRKLSRDPKQKYQKNTNIANTLNFTVPYICERNLTDPSFIDQNNGNKYMEDLKKGL